ncbi:hypothetical protein BT63DRAFT_66062 [Microthyrium microscopicum]|uniref:Globin-sensor domain-containing protein n=1 Tax=Microthyrium microscopicum TaxID=703497 RepID=A0A6A6U2D7_9PEZI|nr:hypothetical protein BT63DRAFT_66062 [Microthyrium microscopicum]
MSHSHGIYLANCSTIEHGTASEILLSFWEALCWQGQVWSSFIMGTRRVQHVDLESSLEARIQFLHSFLDFTSNDITTLLGGGKYIRPSIPSIVDSFYKKLLSYDVTANHFGTRSSGYEGAVDKTPHGSSPQMEYRKLILRGYLQKLFSDASKMEYWEYLDKVGIKHASSPLQTSQPTSQCMDIAFIHLGASLGYLQDLLNEAILLHPRLKSERKLALVKAVGKIIWIQNDLFARWQVQDSGGKRLVQPKVSESGGLESGGYLESEGYLHGTNVLARAENVGMEPETPMEEIGCPFDDAFGKR